MRYRVAKHARGWVCVVYYEDGTRRRIALKASDKFAAHAEASRVVGALAAVEPKGLVRIREIMDAYFAQSDAIWKGNDRYHGEAICKVFGERGVDAITPASLKAYCASQEAAVGTLRKRLSTLRAALNWAARNEIIDKAPFVWLPPAPPPRDRRLTREEFERLDEASRKTHHLRVWLWLARYTAGRAGALLSLKWDQVDFQRRLINLGGSGRQKHRAWVPMHPDLAFALIIAREASETDHVVEFGGKPVASIRKAFRRAAGKAGLGDDVTPHVLRHTAASWMAEAGVPMSEIAAVLGHRDSRTTERVYAKLSPSYLQKAVKALG